MRLIGFFGSDTGASIVPMHSTHLTLRGLCANVHSSSLQHVWFFLLMVEERDCILGIHELHESVLLGV